MKIKYVLFDLDGTLLPMDQDAFMKAYFGGLCKKLAPYGYNPDELIGAIWQGTKMMVKNNGDKTNEEVFWDAFVKLLGERVIADSHLLDEYYIERFDDVQASCGYNEKAKATVDKIKEMGFGVVLATNPLFPSIATEKRMGWAGFTPSDFILFTAYENSRHCKPNLDYYRDILGSIGAAGEECLMVGNDVGEDMIARELGMKVFLLEDCIINKSDEDISVYPHGSFDELLNYIGELKND